jgi:hypothetical protein
MAFMDGLLLSSVFNAGRVVGLSLPECDRRPNADESQSHGAITTDVTETTSSIAKLDVNRKGVQ